MTVRMAFSCTCHPNRNEAYPQRVTAPMKISHVGFRNSLMSGMIWKTRARAKVACFGTSGKTANCESPTKPLVRLVAADRSTDKFRYGATYNKTRSVKEYMAQTFGAQ